MGVGIGAQVVLAGAATLIYQKTHIDYFDTRTNRKLEEAGPTRMRNVGKILLVCGTIFASLGSSGILANMGMHFFNFPVNYIFYGAAGLGGVAMVAGSVLRYVGSR